MAQEIVTSAAKALIVNSSESARLKPRPFRSQAKGLPPILVFAVEVANWSDGTAAPRHQE